MLCKCDETDKRNSSNSRYVSHRIAPRGLLYVHLFMVLYTSRKQPGSSLRGSRILENHCYGRESAAKITRVPLSTFSRETFANIRLQTAFFISATPDLDKDTNRLWKEYALVIKDILTHRYVQVISDFSLSISHVEH